MPDTSFGRGWLSQLAARTASVALSVVSLAVMSRELGATGYGTWAAVMAWTSLAAPLADLGLSSVLVREARGADLDHGVRVALGLQAVLLPFSVVITAALGAVLLPHPAGDVPGLLIASGYLVPTAGYVVLQARFAGAGRFATLAGTELLARTCTALVTIAVVEMGVRGRSLLWLLYLPATVCLAVLLRRTLREGGSSRPLLDWRPASDLLRASLPIAGSLGLFALYLRLDAVLLARLAGVTEVALYSLAYRVTEFALSVPGLFVAVAYPRLVAQRHDRRALQVVVRECLDVLVVVMSPLVLVALLAGPPLMRLLGGAEYAHGGLVLTILLLSAAVSFLTALWGQLLIAMDEARYLLRFSTVNVGVNLVLNLVLIPHWAAVGAAASTLVTECLAAAVVGARLMRMGVLAVSRQTLTAAATAVALGGAGAVVALVLHGDRVVAAALGLALLLASFAVSRPPATRRGSLLWSGHG